MTRLPHLPTLNQASGAEPVAMKEKVSDPWHAN